MKRVYEVSYDYEVKLRQPMIVNINKVRTVKVGFLAHARVNPWRKPITV